MPKARIRSRLVGRLGAYRRVLELAEALARAPRKPGAPTIVSTFAGIGGSSLGYASAGYRELLAVEWNEGAAATFRRNFPGVPVHLGDIAALEGREALRLAGIAPGELDVLDGSPPCQGFSTAGRFIVSDPRNRLFEEFVRLLEAFRPRAMVMENVAGMAKGGMKAVFAEALGALREAGYAVRCWLLNAARYGVPQARERVIFIGAREDLGVDPTPPPPTVPFAARDAVEGLVATRSQRINPWIPATGPAATVCKSSGGYRGKFPDGERSLTVAEAAALTSFPAGFAFEGTDRAKWAGIGNSVPPLLMKAVAGHLAETILELKDEN